MSENTKIEWCDYSWSPWTGCTKVSAGCAHCYAEARDKRHLQEKIDHWGKGAPRLLRAESSWKEPLKWNKKAGEESDAMLEDLKEPPENPTVFPSLCDWLDHEVPIEWLARFLKLIHDTPNLNWLLLTKRPENWRSRMNAVANADFTGLEAGTELADAWTDCLDMPERGVWPANVWIGTSVEDQANADRRIPELLTIPAVGRFLSLEPLLGPVDLTHIDADAAGSPEFCQINSLTGRHTDMGRPCADVPKLDWLIFGGESGPGARPCHVEWIRSLVKQGKSAGVATFAKQLGADPIDRNDRGFEGDSGPSGWPMDTDTTDDFTGGVYQGKPVRVLLNHPKGGDPEEWPEDLRVREFPEGLR